ncbi:MAG: flavodoxin family protein [Candidatus Alkaliphilus sp. MAG34]|nr:flavodoxin family protein [Clostridiales bacterium]
MKALVILGSPRINMNTDTLLNEVIKGLQSQNVEVEKIILSRLKFEPCIACDVCAETGHCYKQDDLTSIYDKFNNSDIIIVGSPMYFNSVTAITKAMIDRCQSFWSSKYKLNRSSIDRNRKRRGMFVGVGGAKYTELEKGFIGATVVMELFFRATNTEYMYNMLVDNTDEVFVGDREELLKEAYEMGIKLTKTE